MFVPSIVQLARTCGLPPLPGCSVVTCWPATGTATVNIRTRAATNVGLFIEISSSSSLLVRPWRRYFSFSGLPTERARSSAGEGIVTHTPAVSACETELQQLAVVIVASKLNDRMIELDGKIWRNDLRDGRGWLRVHGNRFVEHRALAIRQHDPVGALGGRSHVGALGREETTRVLTEASISGKVDYLRGNHHVGEGVERASEPRGASFDT